MGPRTLWRKRSPMAVVGFLQRFGRNRFGRAFGPTWTLRIVCVYAQHPQWNLSARRGLFLPDSEGAGVVAG